MPLILRAIITGFGYKLGAELGRYVAEKVGLKKPDNDGSLPDGIVGTSPIAEDDEGEDPEADDEDPDASSEGTAD